MKLKKISLLSVAITTAISCSSGPKEGQSGSDLDAMHADLNSGERNLMDVGIYVNSKPTTTSGEMASSHYSGKSFSGDKAIGKTSSGYDHTKFMGESPKGYFFFKFKSLDSTKLAGTPSYINVISGDLSKLAGSCTDIPSARDISISPTRIDLNGERAAFGKYTFCSVTDNVIRGSLHKANQKVFILPIKASSENDIKIELVWKRSDLSKEAKYIVHVTNLKAASGTLIEGPESSDLPNSSVKMKMNAIAKAEITSSLLLEADQKCLISSGTEFKATVVKQIASHYLLKVNDGQISGCDLKEFYIFEGHIELTDLVVVDPVVPDPVDPVVPDPVEPIGNKCKNGATGHDEELTNFTGSCALASLIGWTEGTHDRYDYIYSHKTFSISGADDHPRRVICAGAYCSSAAGRYQFLTKTWDTLVQPSMGLPDFRQKSQDKAGLFLIENRGIRKSTFRSQMDYTTFQKTMNKISYEWASLPPGRYGQPIKSMSQAWSKYNEFLK